MADTQNANRSCGRCVQGYALAEARGQMETVFTGGAGDPAARWVSNRFALCTAQGAAYRLAIGLGHVGCDRNPKVCRLTSRSYGRCSRAHASAEARGSMRPARTGIVCNAVTVFP